MIDGKRVIAWTPYGRERTVSLLVKYMERDVKRGLVDEYRLFMNTDENQEGDRAYAHELATKRPDVQAIISADKDVSHGRVVTIIDAVKSGGVKKFAITIDKK